MSKNKQRTGIFDLHDVIEKPQLKSKTKEGVKVDNSSILTKPNILVDEKAIKTSNGDVLIEKALLIVKEQLKLSGLRKPTIKEYLYTFNRFIKDMDLKYMGDIQLDTIYEWLSNLGDISNVTKQSRLRVLKAVMNRFYDNGWYEKPFWKDIKIRTNKKIKPATEENQLSILLSLLDTSDFIGFRDACVILTLYKTGIRINTLIRLEEKHIDFDTNTLNLTGDIMKNHQVLKLPFDDELAIYLKRLIDQNRVIRKHYKKRNNYIFIGKFGDSLINETSSNTLTKRLSVYAKKYGLENINAHAIRRLYATNLLKKGANVALISKALGHSGLNVTTQYLDLDVEDVATNLRDFL